MLEHVSVPVDVMFEAVRFEKVPVDARIFELVETIVVMTLPRIALAGIELAGNEVVPVTDKLLICVSVGVI